MGQDRRCQPWTLPWVVSNIGEREWQAFGILSLPQWSAGNCGDGETSRSPEEGERVCVCACVRVCVCVCVCV